MTVTKKTKPKTKNKYTYLYILQGNYGGWVDLCAEDKSVPGAWKRIRGDLRSYIDNEGGFYRIITRRVPS